MTIARSLADLPRADEGHLPDPDVRFAHLLALKWERESGAERAAHVPSGKRYRASDGGKCARYLAYRAAGIEQTDPMDLCGVWNTSLGKLVHAQWEVALHEAYPDAEVEVSHELEPDGVVRIDAVIRGELVTSYELKTVGGYKFKAAVGKIRRGTPAEGPSREHVVQAALGGVAEDADEVVVGYMAKETISYQEMRELDRFVAEWTFPRAEYEQIAREELARVEGILSLLDAGELAARKIPGVPGEITNANRGEWQVYEHDPADDSRTLLDTGTTWHCRYCSHQSLCARTPPGRVPVETVVTLRKGMS